MTDLFESYASDFAQLQKSIEARLAVDFTSMSADTRRSALRHADAEAEEAGELVMQMELEVQSFPTSVRDRYTKELRALKESLDKLQLDIRAKQGDRTPFGSSGLPLDDNTYTDLEANDEAYQRQRLLQGTQVLERGSERLARSTRLALETEDVGAGILQDLQRQREQIEHSRDTLHGADAHIDRSSRTLQHMIRRAKQQKLVTTSIIVVLVLLILLILYAKLF
ncbi:t-SNARE VTI1 [Malassezia arunalokei]|uniref:t-SNARE VTI1 n=1 Tax=Malassezia arunalokei TaxID=1514897 RepID=A0AAJ5YZ78_9BASI|nr:t-SNARE VTI1 [Malassezia arunalokei]